MRLAKCALCGDRQVIWYMVYRVNPRTGRQVRVCSTCGYKKALTASAEGAK